MENSLQMRRLLSSTPVLGIALQPLLVEFPYKEIIMRVKKQTKLKGSKWKYGS